MRKRVFSCFACIVLCVALCQAVFTVPAAAAGNSGLTPRYPGHTATLDEELGRVKPAEPETETGPNLLGAATASFENITSPDQTAWKKTMGTLKNYRIDANGYRGSCLYYEYDKVPYATPQLDLAPLITGAGVYCVSFYYKTEGNTDVKAITPLMRTETEQSFSAVHGNLFYDNLFGTATLVENGWYHFAGQLYVRASDLDTKRNWKLGLHQINSQVTTIRMDEFEIALYDFNTDVSKTDLLTAYANVATEFAVCTDILYEDPYHDVDVDMLLSNGKVTYRIPGFWDGGTLWKFRFACTEPGTWTFVTECTNTKDTHLHNIKGVVICLPYTGALDIYRHGFVTTEPGTRYFMYADGEPFFYLGDTHWNLGGESAEMIDTLCLQRQKQGYTVIQSEPIGVRFDFENGIDERDIFGLRLFDENFYAIANHGLVHANASLFFPNQMENFIQTSGGYSDVLLGTKYVNRDPYYFYDLSDKAKAELERACRYWAARYSAYPVMWTIAQETDKNCYWKPENGYGWCEINNPFCLEAAYLGKHDPYKHPLSAHQENAYTTTASDSAFRNVSAHTWYAAQWSQSYNGQINASKPEDYLWFGQNKPCVDYEGKYCYLWTKNFGARLQGYMAFLSGMCGYGWGGQDTWCYRSNYNEDVPSDDGVDVITAQDKQDATWEDSLYYDSAFQVGYMRDFFENVVGNWYELVPRFNDEAYMKRDTGVFSITASTENNDKIVTYFYNFSDPALAEKPNATAENAAHTGTLGTLVPGAAYHYVWFDSVKGSMTGQGNFTASTAGEWKIPSKSSGDMVLYVTRCGDVDGNSLVEAADVTAMARGLAQLKTPAGGLYACDMNGDRCFNSIDLTCLARQIAHI